MFNNRRGSFRFRDKKHVTSFVMMTANIDRHCFVDREARTANMGLKEMAGEVLNQTFVLLINSCGRLTVRASKPPLL